MVNAIEQALYRLSSCVSFNVALTNKDLLERLLIRWKGSPERVMQIKGQLYFQNEHDILFRKRTMIGENGELEEVKNLPNNTQIDNQYAKLVRQKANYLLGKPFVVDTKNKDYAELLKQIFNKKFMRLLKNAGKAALNHGICWLYPHYNEQGEFTFRLFPGYEICPLWADSEHTKLQGAIRLYTEEVYQGVTPTLIEKVEVFDISGVHCYVLEGNTLLPDVTRQEQDCSYVMSGGNNMNWLRIPLIPIKYNEQETPLLKHVKLLQDGMNEMMSDFENNMQEDARNTILVLKNYDGANLGEFRRNLATFGAVKVRYDGEAKGGVETLEVTFNAENYKAILEIFKKALIENAMGYDAKDDRLSGNPNQMNIQSMYSDIDLDANDMETELQAAFDDILWFVNAHLANTGKGHFENEDVKIIFNRDILINETESIANCQASVGILSDETIRANHPWNDDPQLETERLEEQEAKAQEAYNPFEQMANENQPEDENE